MNNLSFVGFGFGPIQSGLFLLEAYRSGNFADFTIAEIDADLVHRVNSNQGQYTVNIAHHDHIEKCVVESVRMLNPRVSADRLELVNAVRQANELATALPSVAFYDGDSTSVVGILSEALSSGSEQNQVLYAAENHNHAAEILTEHLTKRNAPSHLRRFQALNTVIGKMSGVISDPAEITRLGISPITPGATKAILVEAFNRILVSRITLSDFHRGIDVFVEKDDLLPFEEAKLFGHNAIHCLIGYLAQQRGLMTMAQVANEPDILNRANIAFKHECGLALCRKYAHLSDPLFTPQGFTHYADDLLQRMVNPNLIDSIERVIRDPKRKLGWSDRIYGTMRLALAHDVAPLIMARGAALGVQNLLGHKPHDYDEVANTLRNLWGSVADDTATTLIKMTWDAIISMELQS